MFPLIKLVYLHTGDPESAAHNRKKKKLFKKKYIFFRTTVGFCTANMSALTGVNRASRGPMRRLAIPSPTPLLLTAATRSKKERNI